MKKSASTRQAPTTLAFKREALLKKAALQRAQLARNVAPLQTPLALIDTGILVYQFAKRHPLWYAGGMALALKLSKKAGLRHSVARYWGAWQVIKKVAAVYKNKA